MLHVPLLDPERLKDLLNAITVMSQRMPSRQLLAGWARFLPQKPESATTWEELFAQHPDLFRKRDDLHYALLYRHNLMRQHATTGAFITDERFADLSQEEKNSYDRPPLTKVQLDDVTDAIETAQRLTRVAVDAALKAEIEKEAAALAKVLATDDAKREATQSWVKTVAGVVTDTMQGGVIGYVLKALGGG